MKCLQKKFDLIKKPKTHNNKKEEPKITTSNSIYSLMLSNVRESNLRPRAIGIGSEEKIDQICVRFRRKKVTKVN